MRSQPHRFLPGVMKRPDGTFRIDHPLQQADGLKKGELRRMRPEMVLHRIPHVRLRGQSKIRLPAFGAHSFSSSFLWSVLTAS